MWVETQYLHKKEREERDKKGKREGGRGTGRKRWRERQREREEERERERERISGFEVFDYVQTMGLLHAGYVSLDNLFQLYDFTSTNMGVDTTYPARLL